MTHIEARELDLVLDYVSTHRGLVRLYVSILVPYWKVENPDGGFDTAPDRWSTVSWPPWKLACQMDIHDPSDLQYILRMTVIHDATIETLDNAMKAAGKEELDAKGNPTFTTWTPDDDEFYAVLATPNGVGQVYFLVDYSNALKKKTIESITICYPYGQMEPSIRFTLASFCGCPSLVSYLGSVAMSGEGE